MNPPVDTMDLDEVRTELEELLAGRTERQLSHTERVRWSRLIVREVRLLADEGGVGSNHRH